MKKSLVLYAVLSLTGCGTLFSGSTQSITIDANVQGVEIYDNGTLACTTPCTYRLSRQRGERTLLARKEGYEENRLLLGTSVNAVALLDIFSTYGFTTDGATGAIWEYSPNNFYVNMMLDNKSKRKVEARMREIRHYVMKNYNSLKTEAFSDKADGQYIPALSQLTAIDEEELKIIVKDNSSAVLLSEEITGRIEK